MSTPPKRFADLEEIITLVRSGAVPRDMAIRILREWAALLKTAVGALASRSTAQESPVSARTAITFAQAITRMLTERVKADQWRHRAGGLKTGAMQHAAAEQSWPKYLAEHDALVAKGMKPKAARDEVRRQNNLTYDEDYFRAELKRRRAKKAEVS
jgi:hypothetical protein